jgi:hypothetical protein
MISAILEYLSLNLIFFDNGSKFRHIQSLLLVVHNWQALRNVETSRNMFHGIHRYGAGIAKVV